MIELIGILLFAGTVLCVVATVMSRRLRSARHELRRVGVELDLVTEKLDRAGKSSGPIADSGRDEAAYTEEEWRVMDHLVVAWNLYVDLPSDHPDDVSDFKDAIHTLQRIILANIALRNGRRPS